MSVGLYTIGPLILIAGVIQIRHLRTFRSGDDLYRGFPAAHGHMGAVTNTRAKDSN